MEPIVYEDSPLADYLRGDSLIHPKANPMGTYKRLDGGDGSEPEWAPVDNTASDRTSSRSPSPSLPPSPTPFAPSGRPMVKQRFRKQPANIPTLNITPPPPMRSLRRQYSVWRSALQSKKGELMREIQAAVAASIDRADNEKFLEKFRYTIVASQLLTGQSIVGQYQPTPQLSGPVSSENVENSFSTEGMVGSVLAALALAVVLSWTVGNAPSFFTRKRLIFLCSLSAAGGFLGQIYMRRRWLHYRRQQSLSEVTSFVSNAHEFDSSLSAALALIQEVELVSRGYRISAPLPPVSRIEDRTQSRKCIRLRRALKVAFTDVLDTYRQTSDVVKGFAEHTNLEKYLDIYDISEFDMLDAGRGFDPEEFDDLESLRTLKIIASRFHVVRKLFLCSLLALEASGETQDLMRWTTAVEALRTLNNSTKSAYTKLQDILSAEESFPPPSAPKSPLTPGRERWRSQLHKLNSLGSGIRGLQAKLQLLREESDRALNDSSDISELGPNLLSQYESIGADLKELMGAWEEGKAALANGIDRNEKRLSSMSTLISPTTSLSGLTTVEEEGNAEAALKALTGGSAPASESNEQAETQEVFEAVARARPRSLLTREERLIKMREDREHKANARQHMDATRGMLKELETVINLRPRGRQSAPPSARVVSM